MAASGGGAQAPTCWAALKFLKPDFLIDVYTRPYKYKRYGHASKHLIYTVSHNIYIFIHRNMTQLHQFTTFTNCLVVIDLIQLSVVTMCNVKSYKCWKCSLAA